LEVRLCPVCRFSFCRCFSAAVIQFLLSQRTLLYSQPLRRFSTNGSFPVCSPPRRRLAIKRRVASHRWRFFSARGTRTVTTPTMKNGKKPHQRTGILNCPPPRKPFYFRLPTNLLPRSGDCTGPLFKWGSTWRLTDEISVPGQARIYNGKIPDATGLSTTYHQSM